MSFKDDESNKRSKLFGKQCLGTLKLDRMTREMGDVEEFKLVVSRRKKRVSRIRNSCDSNVPLSVNDNENDNFNDINCEPLFG